MDKFERVLREMAEEATDAARRELGTRTIGRNKTAGKASGALQKSLTAELVEEKGKWRVRFGSPLPYAAAVHWGVNGTEKNRNAPFTQTKMPPRDDIRQWMKAKGIRPRDSKGRFVEQTEGRMNSLAFVIARGIMRNGYEGVPYFTRGVEATLKRYDDKLAEAMQQDIAEALDKLFEKWH